MAGQRKIDDAPWRECDRFAARIVAMDRTVRHDLRTYLDALDQVGPDDQDSVRYLREAIAEALDDGPRTGARRDSRQDAAPAPFRPPSEGKESNMLVLSRRRDEVLCIGDDIQVTVVDIRGDKVRLGVTAPDHVRIDRQECRQRLTPSTQGASDHDGSDAPTPGRR